MWSGGDYVVVGVTVQCTGAVLCESAQLHAGWRVLDIATGNGNVTPWSAARQCESATACPSGGLFDQVRGVDLGVAAGVPGVAAGVAAGVAEPTATSVMVPTMPASRWPGYVQ